MKKFLTMALSLVLALSLLVPALAEITAEEWSMPIVDEPIKIRAYGLQSPQGGDNNKMICWQYYDELTGIQIEWTNVPTDNQDEVISALLAGDDKDMPDLIYACGFDANALIRYGSTGKFADLTEAYEKYAYNLQAIVEKNPSLLAGMKSADGHIYGLPHLKTGENMRTNKLYVNPNWLKAVDMEMPTNFEEFEEALYAFLENDANENGDPTDEIPYMIRYNDYHFLTNLYNFFGLGNRGDAHRYVDWDYENNDLRFIPTSAQFKDMLTVAHKWYADGILDVEQFQNTSSKQIVAKAGQNLAGFFGDFLTNAGSNYQDVFVCVPVMENYYGQKTWTRQSPMIASPGALVVSANSPYIDEIVKWADYFYSAEGATLYNMGLEHVTFEYDADGVPQFMDHMINDPEGRTLTQMRVQYMGFQSGCGYWGDETYKGAETLPNAKALMDEYRPYCNEETWEGFNATYEEAEKMNRLLGDIKNCINENVAAFITGSRSLDEWDAYVSELENMKVDEYMELYHTLYERYEAAK